MKKDIVCIHLVISGKKKETYESFKNNIQPVTLTTQQLRDLGQYKKTSHNQKQDHP